MARVPGDERRTRRGARGDRADERPPGRFGERDDAVIVQNQDEVGRQQRSGRSAQVVEKMPTRVVRGRSDKRGGSAGRLGRRRARPRGPAERARGSGSRFSHFTRR